MNKKNYIVITCEHLHNRHDLVLQQHSKYLCSNFNPPHFMLRHDIKTGLCCTSKGYRPSLWSEHMNSVLPFHIFNCLCLKINEGGVRLRDQWSRGLIDCNIRNIRESMPPRFLKLAEHSLLHKHYEALILASFEHKPTLILEDDSLIMHSDLMDNVLKAVEIASHNPSYINMIGSPVVEREPKEGTELHKLTLAMSFTTGAYIVSPLVARELISEFFPYSLPIDFHLQYLFKKLKVRGYTIGSGGFTNGSLASQIKSTIQ